MISEVEYVVLICISSFEKCYSSFFCQFLNWILFIYLYCWVLWVPHVFWIFTPHQTYSLFPRLSLCWLFSLLYRKFSVWWSPTCLILLLFPVFLCYTPKSLSIPMSGSHFPMLSSNSFIVSGLMFNPLLSLFLCLL